MGNYASCALGGGQNGKHSKSAKVILPSGEIKQFHHTVKAAELMVEIPNYFIANSKSLNVGRRFSPLNADEDLEVRNVYVMFPMQRVKAFVTAADMGALYLVAKRGGAGKVRVVPAYSGEGEEMCEKKVGLEELCSPEFKHLMSACRSKRPVLETIVEEPSYSLRE